jgi:hypothetical protein
MGSEIFVACIVPGLDVWERAGSENNKRRVMIRK